MALPVNGRQAATMSPEATEFPQNQQSMSMGTRAWRSRWPGSDSVYLEV